VKDRRVIVITGATGGIGQAIARRFGQAGCRIVVHYHRNKGRAERLVADLERLKAEVFPVQADIRSLTEMQALTRAVTARWNQLDVLVANAGVRRDGLLLRTTDEAWDSVIDTNLTGTWNSLVAVGEYFIRQGAGNVIAIGSVAGLVGRAGQANYAASKAGLIGLVRSAAMEWAPHNVQLNIILPGIQPTGMTEGLAPGRLRTLKRQNLLRKSAPISDVADLAYLLSNMTGVSGQIFNLDSRIV
jgi:3-oxoacyl-[acyl-carrier protein] reductase